MICAWEALLGILPHWLRQDVSREVQEIRLRLGIPPVLTGKGKSLRLRQQVRREDLEWCINAASRYSPWTAASAAQGYLTAPGGHRIGICGQAILKEGRPAGIREVSSLCIRVARDFPGISGWAAEIPGSMLIIGAPGWGKTTLLRDLARQLGFREPVAVVDERKELFPPELDRGPGVDVLSGCPKAQGLKMVLRSMGPKAIAVDEITCREDCLALCDAANCGVRLLATAHAGSLREFLDRPVYRPLLEQKIFGTALILHADQSYGIERMEL